MRDYALGTTFDIKFTTRQISGAPSTLSGVPVISAYPDNSTTEITAGITLSVDFDSRTGLNNVRVVATSGNGYASGSNYALVITTGTVNSVSVVGEVIGEFSIEAQSPLRPATAGRTAVVDSAGLIDANVVKLGPTGAGTAQTARDVGASVLLSSGTGTGQIKLASGYVAMTWADIAAPTTAVNLSGTSTKALEPTVAARTLDVTATGAAGIDWGNVENPATTVSLTNSTISIDFGSIISFWNLSTAFISSGIGNIIVTNLDATVSGRAVAGDAMALTSGERDSVADALLDRANGIETGLTPRNALRLAAATIGSKLSGAGTGTETLRNAVADSKNRVIWTVDASGNRSAATYDFT